MEITSPAFKAKARAALANAPFQAAMRQARSRFVDKRREAVAALPEFDALRNRATEIRDHSLAHLDLYLAAYAERVAAAGGSVHFADTEADARDTILAICRRAGARVVTKGKSMVGEEIALNQHLEAAGIRAVETDLGEYIIQLRGEPPSHIIAPAIHLTRAEVEADFRKAHAHLPPRRPLHEAADLLAEARGVLRQHFLAAEVGITGANFLVAETGSAILVTNEGNGDLTQTLPRVHVVLATIEKMVPTMADAGQLLRLLARSATGQEMSVYTTVSGGPRRTGDPDGPAEYHVIILDNGRSALLGTRMQPVLRCIRCAACANHCPVFQQVGGHAYGSVYSGPIGAALTPAIAGIAGAADLPDASTFCGKCEDVCPVRIPLPGLMRHWREEAFAKRLQPSTVRHGLALWAWFARRPAAYRRAAAIAVRMLALFGGRRGRYRWLPFARGWTKGRDLPAPAARTFQSEWARQRKR